MESLELTQDYNEKSRSILTFGFPILFLMAAIGVWTTPKIPHVDMYHNIFNYQVFSSLIRVIIFPLLGKLISNGKSYKIKIVIGLLSLSALSDLSLTIWYTNIYYDTIYQSSTISSMLQTIRPYSKYTALLMMPITAISRALIFFVYIITYKWLIRAHIISMNVETPRFYPKNSGSFQTSPKPHAHEDGVWAPGFEDDPHNISKNIGE